MITYINKDNAAAYHQLFIKAEDALKAERPSDLGIDNWDDFKIGSLNEYFAYLETLMNLSSLNLDQKRMFVRLPLDEDIFEINADTRTISVPSTFARYGIGVQGDEMAEVVYFTIDRFFDSMDLAGNNIQIAIQWEAKDANKQTIIGFSRNFGKEIINVKDKNGDNKNKIVFGWPISSELTQTNGIIKFAVRFYSIETVDGNNQFTYSFTTLPAEVSVNTTLDYNLLNNSIPEVDHGKVITGRIRSSGIYDPDAAEMPEEPTVTTQLYALSSEGKIIDLPGDGSGVELAISAQPTTVGTINYRWNKYAYNENTGDYASSTSTLPSEDSITKQYLEITSNIAADDPAFFYDEAGELVVLASTLEETNGYYIYNSIEGGFKKSNTDVYIKLYKEFSIATVHSVGKYIVQVIARAGANTADQTSDTITIPGPLKPVVKYDDEANIADNIVHIIADENGVAVLKVDADKGETGKPADEVGSAPVVTLTYDWVKKEQSGDIPLTEEIPGDMDVSAVSAEDVPGPVETVAQAQYNQSHVAIKQNGNIVSIYKLAELEKFVSTNAGQADRAYEWLALDIDTRTDDITQFTWQGYPITQDDVADAESAGLPAGHIIFWIKLDTVSSMTCAVSDVDLTFNIFDGAPAYNFNEAKNIMTVSGLTGETLDEVYSAKVTASRNNVKTAQESLNYRITHAPEKPILKYREYDGNNFRYVVKDYTTQDEALTINMKNRAGEYNKIAFAVEPPTQSDKLAYVWMRANIQDSVDADWEASGLAKLQVDVDDLLPDLFVNAPGDADIAVNGIFNLSVLRDLGQVIDNEEENGPALQLSDSTPAGYYYCIVINELNNNRVANVTPFFHVS